jgi:hypothetical protein
MSVVSYRKLGYMLGTKPWSFRLEHRTAYRGTYDKYDSIRAIMSGLLTSRRREMKNLP